MGYDQDRIDSGDRNHATRTAVGRVPRVDWIHDANLERILEGEVEPDSVPDVD